MKSLANKKILITGAAGGFGQEYIKQAIRGIRKRKLHVYPGYFAKIVHFASKFMPIVSSHAH